MKLFSYISLALLSLSVASCTEATKPNGGKVSMAPAAPKTDKTVQATDATSLPKTEAVPKPLSEFSIHNDGVGKIDSQTRATEESLGPLFPDCEVSWRREKGKAGPHITVRCPNGLDLDVVANPSDRSGPLLMVKVFGKQSVSPTGIRVGASYSELRQNTPSLECLGVPGRPIENGVIYRAHTLCSTSEAPRIQYVFRREVFGPSEPAQPDKLKVGEIRWTPGISE